MPVVRDRLIGRERELATARSLLLRDDIGLLSLTGAGGSGKTSLALHLAADLLNSFDDGVFFVSLAPVADPALVASTISQTLGLREAGGRSVLDALLDYVRRRSMLLVLDNFEHLLSAGPLAAELLAASVGLKILVTSRAPLKVRGEHELVVPPLALPEIHRLPGRAVLAESPAVALFIERARAVRPAFVLTNENAATVAQIVVRLDGLPLAIELAAARLRLFSPRELLARLDHRLPLLTSGGRDVPARQRTLRDAIAWSCDLLDEEERRLYRRLAVFVGGFTLEAAGAVCAASPDPDGSQAIEVLDAVASLVDMNLLRRDDQANGESRYSMLETIREYGSERLMESGEAAELRRRHAEYFLALAEALEPNTWGWDYGHAATLLERDHDNLRAALTWSQSELVPPEIGLRLTTALFLFWIGRGDYGEGRRWQERAIARRAGADPSTLAWALCTAGHLAQHHGEHRRARELFEEATDLFAELHDDRGRGIALGGLGRIEELRGNNDRAAVLCRESLEAFTRVNDRWGIAWALYQMGRVEYFRGDHAQAAQLLEESLSRRADAGGWIVVSMLHYLARVVLAQGNRDRARELARESLAISTDAGFRRGLALSHLLLGRLAHAGGNDDQAAEHFVQSLSLWRGLDDRVDVAECLEGFAAALASGTCDALTCAARLLGAAEALRQTVGTLRSPVEQPAYEADVTDTRVRLGEEAFAAEWRRGYASPLDQLLTDVIEGSALAQWGPPSGAQAPPIAEAHLLSQREWEVAALIGQGHTNRQIADVLIISERTAETHARNIREKLGLATRGELVAWATRRQIVPGTGREDEGTTVYPAPAP